MTLPLVVVKLEEPSYGPGELLVGAFALDGEIPDDLATVELSVLWRTEGRGDEDIGVHHYQCWAAKDESLARLENPQSFSTTAPPSPYSYDGTLIKIQWLARVRVRREGGEEVVEEFPFTIGPR